MTPIKFTIVEAILPSSSDNNEHHCRIKLSKADFVMARIQGLEETLKQSNRFFANQSWFYFNDISEVSDGVVLDMFVRYNQ